jgi:hypothetical protein
VDSSTLEADVVREGIVYDDDLVAAQTLEVYRTLCRVVVSQLSILNGGIKVVEHVYILVEILSVILLQHKELFIVCFKEIIVEIQQSFIELFMIAQNGAWNESHVFRNGAIDQFNWTAILIYRENMAFTLMKIL